MVVMIFVLGPHHPPTLDDDDAARSHTRLVLARGRVDDADRLCFTPAPIGEFLG